VPPRAGPSDTPAYAELSCQSAFSFLAGASEPEVLVERAAELGYGALALTDRDGLYGSPRAHQAAKRAGLPLVHGTTLSLARVDTKRYDGRPDEADDRVVLLARDEAGWRSLCRLVSAARSDDRRAPLTPVARLGAEATGLHALVGPHVPEATVDALHELLGAGRLDLMVHDRLLRRDRRGQAVQRERAARHGLPLVVTGGVRFARRTDKPLHDVLTCVRHKRSLDEAATRLLPNAEFCLRPVERIAHLFRHLPEALARSVDIAQACRFSLDAFAYRFPSFAVPEDETPFSHLHQLVHEGARGRYRPMTSAAMAQLSKELSVIERLDLAGYFLVVHDVVRFCEREGILCQGRGSAANSAVCYALGITSVDPVGMGLLFERFLSEERGETPDIDLDIAHQDRERVLQYVYRRYGRDRAAMAAEVITYRARSAVRDAGKAFGFSVEEVDTLAKGIDRRFDSDRDGLPESWAARSDDRRLPMLLAMAERMCGLPRHLSIHVGGMIVSGPPLTDAMPVEPAAMKDRTVVPWDKDDLSSLGIIKIDLLGLGMLTAIDRCLGFVSQGREARGEPPLRLHEVPSDDERVWDMLCAADTVGVFQVESRAQMNCLPRLRPRAFYDLVVEVALIRPGPIQGQMVHPYLRRRAGREQVTYPHPRLAPILERTLGVPLFQEQGMKIAVEMAGFTAGEADELRRAMGHKRSHERMAALAERLVGGMVRGGVGRDDAERILAQLSAFADYGFPESHAASFARLVWVSAWLRRHHPAAFLCALLNAQPMGFYQPAVLCSDAQRHGVIVLPVDVLDSDWDSKLERSEAQDASQAVAPADAWADRDEDDAAHAVRLGLRTVRGLGERHEEGVRRALASVAAQGPFTSSADFAKRSGVGRAVMEHLARLGALRGFAARRRHALWDVAQLARKSPGPLADALPIEGPVHLRAMTVGEEMAEDYRMGGVSTSRHPLAVLRPRLLRVGVTAARDLPRQRQGAPVMVAGMAICRQRPPTAGGLTFVTLEDETGFANLIVAPDVAAASPGDLRSPLMLAGGRLEQADGVTNLRVTRLTALTEATRIEGIASHDYH
jgi:error-prone DNA polymerase